MRINGSYAHHPSAMSNARYRALPEATYRRGSIDAQLMAPVLLMRYHSLGALLEALVQRMIHLSPSAASEIKRLRSKQRRSNLLFRIQAQPGGCSGLFYALMFAEAVEPGEQAYDCNGISVVIDAQSWNYINGLTIDYSEDLMGGGFRFHNPNATQTCGCGNSFSTSAEFQA